ncbi:retrotransposable element ORF2 protein [Nymphaea thermarum]|nr:retrotransposable element ORF2 protein [Nymphaea thermarum]
MEDGGLEYEDQDMIQQICFNYFSNLLGNTDGSGEILPAQEVVHSLQSSKGPSCYLKLDLSKAYNLVNWKFLENALLKVGFSEGWVTCIMSCVTSASTLVLVNGVQGEYFYLARGLRQGDRLSPYLFIVIMEIFSRAIFGRMADCLFRPPLIPRVGRAPLFLAFADDVLLFSDISQVSIEKVRETLWLLVANVGLKVNPHKSNIYFSDAVSAEVKDRICATLGWPCDDLPTTYLGLPLFAGKLKNEWCQPLINKVEKLLFLWKSATLSYAGQLCLLKHVLSSVIGFWTSVFALPKKTWLDCVNSFVDLLDSRPEELLEMRFWTSFGILPGKWLTTHPNHGTIQIASRKTNGACWVAVKVSSSRFDAELPLDKRGWWGGGIWLPPVADGLCPTIGWQGNLLSTFHFDRTASERGRRNPSPTASSSFHSCVVFNDTGHPADWNSRFRARSRFAIGASMQK